MMPEWLPGCCATNGEWVEVVAALYAVFQRDIAANPPRVDGCPVWWQRRIRDGYEEAFWHLITRDDAAAGDRRFDPRRAERLSWCGPILRHCNDPAITRWRYRNPRGKSGSISGWSRGITWWYWRSGRYAAGESIF